MKNLLKKEVMLAASPLTYFFIAFSAMTMIPGYPILIGAFFICLGIFYSFQYSREHNDTLYTALLPIKKSSVVNAKYVFTVSVQLIGFILILLFAAIRMTVLSEASVYTQNPLMNANAAYLGYVLIVFTEFNFIFLSGFFKTAYYIGKPFIVYCIVSFLTVSLAEVIWHFPDLAVLNATSFNTIGGIVLAAGIAVYISGTYLSLKISQKRFESIDL